MLSILLKTLVFIYLCCSVASDDGSNFKHLSSRRFYDTPADLRRSMLDYFRFEHCINNPDPYHCGDYQKLKEQQETQILDGESKKDLVKLLQVLHKLCQVSPESPECQSYNFNGKKANNLKGMKGKGVVTAILAAIEGAHFLYDVYNNFNNKLKGPFIPDNKLKEALGPAIQDAKLYADNEMETFDKELSEISGDLHKLVPSGEEASPELQNKITNLKMKAKEVITTLANKLKIAPHKQATPSYGLEDDGTIDIDVLGKRDFRYLGGKMKLFLQPKIKSLKYKLVPEKVNEANSKEINEDNMKKRHQAIAKEILTDELKKLHGKISNLQNAYLESVMKNAPKSDMYE